MTELFDPTRKGERVCRSYLTEDNRPATKCGTVRAARKRSMGEKKFKEAKVAYFDGAKWRSEWVSIGQLYSKWQFGKHFSRDRVDPARIKRIAGSDDLLKKEIHALAPEDSAEKVSKRLDESSANGVVLVNFEIKPLPPGVDKWMVQKYVIEFLDTRTNILYTRTVAHQETEESYFSLPGYVDEALDQIGRDCELIENAKKD